MGAMFYSEPANVYVAGSDPIVRDAVSRLMSLDPQLAVSTAFDSVLLAELKDMPLGEFIEMVKSLPATRPERHLHPVPGGEEMRALLSDREMQVVKLVAEGLSNKEISVRLELSDKTVKNHISHILAKLNLSARTQVAVHALRAGIA